GQGMVEYGLIIALVAVAVIVAITALGDNIKGIFNKAGSELSNAITSSSAT
ncbi:MAG TPA: Flp family type IVb pilin, partial [Oscillospiraceae bacterium]|nr:Flp family type IVb pilin [Oscillospiraceae bacterium]HPF55296.1 Flp family type IVb pilin [Clostridiales bacterium]